MKRLYLLLGLLALVGNAFAKNHDLFFHNDGERGLCVSYATRGIDRRNASDTENCNVKTANDIRIRVVDPQTNPDRKFGFDLIRPFFILDGIYLSTDSLRTLSSFHEEAMQFGLTDLLSKLGYTPILVQFSETVRNALVDNADYFTKLLHFVNENKFFGFPNKMDDGMIVLGISQGGILGRYGAYRYDIARKSTEAPIRIYGSLDSPHQGAVIPKSLFYTIDFWAKYGGSAEAEAFSDLINGPGASGLLITNALPERDSKKDIVYENDLTNNRFLFGEYRKAVDYKKFPAILIAQGQMKGVSPAHSNTFFKLNRRASKAGIVVGRAQSKMLSADGSTNSTIAYNRVYQIRDREVERNKTEQGSFDFVQGSTYPFARTMYDCLKQGFKDAMPDGMVQSISLFDGKSIDVSITTKWEVDTLEQKNSTFIPVTSALDLNCNGDLSIRKDCAFTEKYSDVNFENPGTRSSATAMYAVDPTHPRYNEPVSGRHVEMPVNASGVIDTAVLRGMQVDIWRFMCEVAKYDYDKTKSVFRNENLTGVFEPNASCMDQSKMPEIIRTSGLRNVRRFGYARYDYSKFGTEYDEHIGFDVPAGWHKVATFDNGSGIVANGEFVVDVTVNPQKTSWMKAELLLLKAKNGAAQLQLQEVNVPVDGMTHTLRWPLNFAENSISGYRWFRLVLNSDGGTVIISRPRFERSVTNGDVPTAQIERTLYPNNAFNLYPMARTQLSPYSDGLGIGLNADFFSVGSAFFVNFGEKKSLKNYTNLKVSYWPGTCQNSSVYFDSYKEGGVSLKGGTSEGAFVRKVIPLSSIIDTDITPDHVLAASRFVVQSTYPTEKCVIREILLE
ncbi:MAG: hypothetical protein MJY85_10960 [Fibrobacter sp.]|nr:hypothetical protein [Fibrobacter sp.]